MESNLSYSHYLRMLQDNDTYLLLRLTAADRAESAKDTKGLGEGPCLKDRTFRIAGRGYCHDEHVLLRTFLLRW